MSLPGFEKFNYIRSLEQCGLDKISEVGGKNASLGELVRAGFNIPPGFAVTVCAYKAFVQKFDLKSEMDKVLSLNPTDREAGIRELIESRPMPEEMKKEIKEALEALDNYLYELEEENSIFAVRSSATVEDLSQASFAGQFDTLLWLRSWEEVIKGIKKCWSSLFNPRAIAYRNFKGILHKNSLMSVGVQKMIDAKSSGVIFTLEPITGDRESIVINANWGLGESVVGGITSVDSFMVEKANLDIVKNETSMKTRQTMFDPEKGEVDEIEVPQEIQDTPCLNKEEVKELARQAKLIEEHYGKPQDIEFAIDKHLKQPENIFITQSRAVTTAQASSAKTKAKESKDPIDHITDMMVKRFYSKSF